MIFPNLRCPVAGPQRALRKPAWWTLLRVLIWHRHDQPKVPSEVKKFDTLGARNGRHTDPVAEPLT
jgi:hypothetical protein